MREIKSFFQDAEFRHPGRPGNLAIEKKVAERFAQSGLSHGEIRFETPSFLPGRTRILIDGIQPIRLSPLHPTIFRPGNFPERQFETRMVYLGRGTVDDLTALKGVRLDGAVALMEFNCGDSWQRLLRFGLKGFVFIGSDNYSHLEAQAKIYATEVSVPRFFVEAPEGRRLKETLSSSGPSLNVRIEAEPSRWQNVFLRDLWVLIPGSDAELKNEVCVFVAGMDSNCVVPEMAAGGQSAANLHILLKLLDEFAKQPPARSVILAAVNAHTQHYLGERMLAWHLLASGEESQSVRDLMAADMRTEEFLQRAYGAIQLDPPDKDTEKTLIEMRTLVDDSTGKKLVVKEPIVALARRDVNRVKMERLAIQRSDLSKEEKTRKFESSNKLYRKHVNVLTLFNRVGIRTKLSDLSEDELEILRGYVAEIVERNKTWAALDRRDLEIDVANSKIKDALAGR
ncbi:MAG: hypothetical protein KAJ01_10120, partial [Candidatus Hydrogenedentes bacterium]|nr:hypothetical protein [Candidatus Hydrogenedentota bacterium]